MPDKKPIINSSVPLMSSVAQTQIEPSILPENMMNQLRMDSYKDLTKKATPFPVNDNAAMEEPEAPKLPITSDKNTRLLNLDDVTSTQNILSENGYNIGKVDGLLGPKTIKGMQQFLKDEGFYIGQDKFKDGGIDGKIGEYTKNAIAAYNKQSTTGKAAFYQSRYADEEGYIGRCDEGQCVEFTQAQLKRSTNLKDSDLVKAGLHGDAWNIEKHILKQGGSKIYSVNEPIDKNKLKNIKPGDHISIFTGGNSAYQEIASSANASGEGAPTPTHSALVDSEVMFDDELNKEFVYVVHNMHKKNPKTKEWEGHSYRNKMYLDNFRFKGYPTFKVTGITSPNYGNAVEKKKTFEPDSNLELASDDQNAYRQTAIAGINEPDFRKKAMSEYGLDNEEYLSIGKIALSVLDQETGFGEKGKFEKIDNVKELRAKEIGASVVKAVGDTFGIKNSRFSGEASRGFGQIKFDTNFGGEEQRLKTEYDLAKEDLSVKRDDGDKSAKAAFLLIAKHYKALKNDPKVSDKDKALYLAVQKYNRYDLNRKYGEEKKSSYEYADNYDLDYVNKIIANSEKYRIGDQSNNRYQTIIDSLKNKQREIVPNTQVDQYGLGSWLKDNIGNVVQTVGGAAMMAVPGLQTVGAGMMASGVSGAASNTVNSAAQDEQIAYDNRLAARMAMMKPMYAVGGPLPSGAIPTIAPSINTNRLVNTPLTEVNSLVPTTFSAGPAKRSLGLDSYSNLDATVDYTALANQYFKDKGQVPIREGSKLFPVKAREGAGSGLSDFLVESRKLPNLPIPGVNVYNRGNEEWRAVFDKRDNLITDKSRADSVVNRRANKLLKRNLGKETFDIDNIYRKSITNDFGMNYEYATGGDISFLTEYKNGGTHEQNPHGGIPVGQKARVEEGEFKFTDPTTGEAYIFTDRF